MIIKILFLLFFIVSCATSKKTKELEVVKIGFDHGEAVEINDDNTNSSYGPALPEGSELLQGSNNNQKVVGLFLREGLYLSHGYLALYRFLESKKVRPTVQACLGFSCVIASLYAKYGNSSQVEWKTFALWKKLKESKVFSNDWKETLSHFIEAEFKGKKLEELSGVLAIYLWNNEKNKLYSLSRGDVVWALEHAVFLNSQEKWENALVSTYVASKNDLKSYGADIVIDVSVTPKKNLLARDDGYLLGLFGRLYGLQRRNTPTINFDYDLPLDEKTNFSLIITQGTREVKRNSQALDDVMTQIFPE